MVLSVFAYNVEPDALQTLLPIMGNIGRQLGASYRMEAFTDNITDATAIVRSGEGIALMLLGVDDIQTDPKLLSIRLGRLAKQVNRDNYVVYFLKSQATLVKVLPYCSGASGLIAPPLSERSLKPVFEHVFGDFKRLQSDDADESGNWVNLKSKGRLHRVRTDDICSVQAVNKMIEVHTTDQVIVLNEKLESMEQMLGDGFVRCHRSYLVNKNRIEYIDFKDKTIRMMDGSSLPFARSSKEDMHRIAAGNADD